MREYRAVVIDGRKIVGRSVLLLLVLTVVGLVAINLNIAGIPLSSWETMAEETVEESIPAMKGFSIQGGTVSGKIKNGAKKALCFFMSFDATDPRTVVFGEIPIIHTVSQGHLVRNAEHDIRMVYNPEDADVKTDLSPEPEQTPENGYYPIKEVDSAQSKAVGTGKILIRNETNYGIDVENFLNEPLKFDMKGEAPKVLIVHTHATESYAEEGASEYDSGKSDRSMDCNKNVVSVGDGRRNLRRDPCVCFRSRR